MRAKASAIFSFAICVVLAVTAVCLLAFRRGAASERPLPDAAPALAPVDGPAVSAPEATEAPAETPNEPGAGPEDTAAEPPDEPAPEAQTPEEPAPESEPASAALQDPHEDPIVREQSAPAPEGYFSDAAFLGSSVVTGLSMYDYDGLLDGADFYAANSVTILGISSYLDQMQGHAYGKVYVGLGTNEMSYNRDELRARFVDMIARLRDFSPDCVIYLMTVPPVSRSKSGTSSSFTKLLVLEFNQMLYEVAREQGVWYLDVYSALCDEDGYLPENVTADGVHFSAEHYQYWFDLLKTHYII